MKDFSLRAVLFDFDGVIADTEPLHFRWFQKVLEEEGVRLTREDYYKRYLGLDDRACFQAVFKDSGKNLSSQDLERLIEKKNKNLLTQLDGSALLFPGVSRLVEDIQKDYYLAVVSGALRSEIEAILKKANLDSYFRVIVSAEDVSQGKPSPEGFLKALRLLNRDFIPEAEILLPQECLCLEDSPWGISSARQAGMKCLAVQTSYKEEALKEANAVVSDLSRVTKDDLARLFQGTSL